MSILAIAMVGCLAPGPTQTDVQEFTATYASGSGTFTVWSHAGHRAMTANGSVVDALLIGFEGPETRERYLATPDMMPIQRISDCAPRLDDGCRYRYVYWFLEDRPLPLALGIGSDRRADDSRGSEPLELTEFGRVDLVADPVLPVPLSFMDASGTAWDRTGFVPGAPPQQIAQPKVATTLTPRPLPAPDAAFTWPFPGAGQPLAGRLHSIDEAIQAYLDEGEHRFDGDASSICVDHASAAADQESFTLDLSQGSTETRRIRIEWRPPSLLDPGSWEIHERAGVALYPCITMGHPEPGAPWVGFGTMLDAVLPVAEQVGGISHAGLTRHETIGGRAWEPLYTIAVRPDWADAQRLTVNYQLRVTIDGSWYHAYVDPTQGLFSSALAWDPT